MATTADMTTSRLEALLGDDAREPDDAATRLTGLTNRILSYMDESARL